MESATLFVSTSRWKIGKSLQSQQKKLLKMPHARQKRKTKYYKMTLEKVATKTQQSIKQSGQTVTADNYGL